MINTLKDTLLLSNSEGLHFIPHEEIIRIEGNSNYSTIHTTGGRLIFACTLKRVTCQLNDEQFWRIHKSHIINIKFLRLKSRDQIRLSNGDILPLSRNTFSISNLQKL